MPGYLALSLPDERLANAYGRALAQLTRRRQSISAIDLLIGVTAIVAGAALVTRNARDFDRIPDLRVLSY